MPEARPPMDPIPPAPLSSHEADFIKRTVRRFYGDDAIIRNYGPNPRRLDLHVETSIAPGMERHECLGFLMCEIARDQISLEVTERGRPLRGSAKIAYRQGDVI
jgi:hypothetical protein